MEPARLIHTTIPAPFEPVGRCRVVCCCQRIRKVKYAGGANRYRQHLVHCGEVCAIEDIGKVCTSFEAHGAISLEAESLADANVCAPVIRSNSGVAADIEKSIGAAARVTIGVDAGAQRERNSTAYEDARTDGDIRKCACAEVMSRPTLEWTFDHAAEYKVVTNIKSRNRSRGEEPRRERWSKGRIEVGLIVERFAPGVVRLEGEVITKTLH